MEDKMKLALDQYLNVLIKQFNLSHEDNESLKVKLTYRFMQEDVILFIKNSQVLCDTLKQSFDKARHKKTIDILKKYADEAAILKYMEDEGWKYEDKDMEGYIDGVKFNCFIVYPKKDDDSIEKVFDDLWKFAKSVGKLWEFKEIDNGLVIGWI